MAVLGHDRPAHDALLSKQDSEKLNFDTNCITNSKCYLSTLAILISISGGDACN